VTLTVPMAASPSAWRCDRRSSSIGQTLTQSITGTSCV
jgi:hypothetical protein